MKRIFRAEAVFIVFRTHDTVRERFEAFGDYSPVAVPQRMCACNANGNTDASNAMMHHHQLRC